MDPRQSTSRCRSDAKPLSGCSTHDACLQLVEGWWPSALIADTRPRADETGSSATDVPSGIVIGLARDLDARKLGMA